LNKAQSLRSLAKQDAFAGLISRHAGPCKILRTGIAHVLNDGLIDFSEVDKSYRQSGHFTATARYASKTGCEAGRNQQQQLPYRASVHRATPARDRRWPFSSSCATRDG